MRIPSSTYRLQFNPAFRLKDAIDIIGYLDALGITDIYASPVFKARAGSLHGYDIVDHNHLNPEVGTVEELTEALEALKGRHMGWVQDIVPNHMSYGSANAMLMDVMEKGRSSRFLSFFDIEWDHPYEGIRERVLAPFLGRIYGEALEAGQILLAYSDAGLTVNYSGNRFPLRIDSYHYFLTYGLRKLVFELGREHPDFIKLLGILYVLKNLPTGEDDELHDQVLFVKRMLWELYSRNPAIKKLVDESIELFNGVPGNPESYNLLDRLLSEQVYKLSFWKVAAEEINYRRFFNINELITLRAEDEHVFGKTHSLVFNLIGYGITGLRVDHIDGLLDPLEYLTRLKEKTGGIYIVAEKILGPDEELPLNWPLEGTTGYDFLARVNGLFCDHANETRFTKIYTSFTGLKTQCTALFYEKKKLITEMDMMSDVSNLAQLLKITLSSDRYGSDITLQGLKKAIVEVMAEFPVYRTYISPGIEAAVDIRYIKDAARRAIGKNPALLNELTFLEKVLTLNYREYQSEEEKREWLRFVMRFQQFTGPLMAKGIEDTLFYVYNRLISLNEVGGSPSAFGTSLEDFHSRNRTAAALRPASMSATATHDTKRGEDARARVNVLSELPGEWERHLKRWSSLNRKKRGQAKKIPDRNDEYYFYQSLLGSFPFNAAALSSFKDRMREHMIKAVREAKIHTAWLKPDKEYEDAFVRFMESCLDETKPNPFLDSFIPFQKKVAWYGMMNSLSQTLLKITCPGVPDFYQGTELWDFSMVDPDNRRPVDFSVRKMLLDDISARADIDMEGLIAELLKSPEDGRIKLFLMYMALNERKKRFELFNASPYMPLECEGEYSRNLVAFARTGEREASITIAARFLTSVVREGEYAIGEKWGDTTVILPDELHGYEWKDAFTGQSIPQGKEIEAGEALGSFPVAFLVSSAIASE
ncbi:MAG: malto-oligosyltrehalose synthase [Deltaproteobacteria bacterium GWA2_54_12]|nr:MAG: malto-oligosyltrehalose synthase [Deltaproteobacteria bacterium GWA2_54_12]